MGFHEWYMCSVVNVFAEFMDGWMDGWSIGWMVGWLGRVWCWAHEVLSYFLYYYYYYYWRMEDVIEVGVYGAV